LLLCGNEKKFKNRDIIPLDGSAENSQKNMRQNKMDLEKNSKKVL